MATAPLDQRLANHALGLALGSPFNPHSAAVALAGLADGNRAAVLRALAHIGVGMADRPSPAGERAAAALRLTLTTSREDETGAFLADLQQDVIDAFLSASYATHAQAV